MLAPLLVVRMKLKRWFRQVPNPESQKTKSSEEECYVKTEDLWKQSSDDMNDESESRPRTDIYELYEQSFRKFRVTFSVRGQASRGDSQLNKSIYTTSAEAY